MFKTQRISIANLLLPLAFATVVVLGICGSLYLREANQISFTTLDNENRRMERFAGLFQADVASGVSDLRLLITGDGFVSYIDSGNPADLDRAAKRAVFFSKDNPDYDKIRYIDETGQEVFRVNHGGVVVLHDELQNKADRPFFQKASVLQAGQIYLSAIDLNVDHGEIEKPIKPTLRLAMPVFDSKGERRGIYVINFLMQHSMDRLRMFVPKYQQRFRFLNAQGYWLTGATLQDAWGFALPGGTDLTMAKSDPALWAKVSSQPLGQEPYRGGYFTWHRTVPADSAPGKPVTLISEEPYLICASIISGDEWEALFASLRQTFVVVALVLMILTVIVTWFFQARRLAQIERDRFFVVTRDMLCVAGFDGYFKRVNPAWEKALGYSAEEMVAKPFLDFVHPDDKEKTIAATSSLAVGGEIISFENRYRCKDGTYRWLLWSARPLVPEGLIYGSARDLTERKMIEESRRLAEQQVLNLNEELKERAKQLESANKELESFSYSVSHDLRAPLRHIHGFVEMLQRAPAIQEDAQSLRQMGVIAKAAKEMGVLIDDLLAFSRTGRAEMHLARTKTREIVDQIIQDRAMETQGRKVVWEIKPLGEVSGDPNLLRLVWINLLDNALKYTKKRDEARIEIGQMPDNETSASEAVFYVKDNGVGFDMQYASKLFGVFQRLHRAEDFEGTGIGLANVQRIVHRHGGRIWAEAKVDSGATFYFSIPLRTI